MEFPVIRPSCPAELPGRLTPPGAAEADRTPKRIAVYVPGRFVDQGGGSVGRQVEADGAYCTEVLPDTQTEVFVDTPLRAPSLENRLTLQPELARLDAVRFEAVRHRRSRAGSLDAALLDEATAEERAAPSGDAAASASLTGRSPGSRIRSVVGAVR